MFGRTFHRVEWQCHPDQARSGFQSKSADDSYTQSEGEPGLRTDCRSHVRSRRVPGPSSPGWARALAQFCRGLLYQNRLRNLVCGRLAGPRAYPGRSWNLYERPGTDALKDLTPGESDVETDRPTAIEFQGRISFCIFSNK
jgi:hypothetical protein